MFNSFFVWVGIFFVEHPYGWWKNSNKMSCTQMPSFLINESNFLMWKLFINVIHQNIPNFSLFCSPVNRFHPPFSKMVLHASQRYLVFCWNFGNNERDCVIFKITICELGNRQMVLQLSIFSDINFRHFINLKLGSCPFSHTVQYYVFIEISWVVQYFHTWVSNSKNVVHIFFTCSKHCPSSHARVFSENFLLNSTCDSVSHHVLLSLYGVLLPFTPLYVCTRILLYCTRIIYICTRII